MKNIIKIGLFIAVIINIAQSCSPKTTTQSNDLAQNAEGLALMKANCFSCHSPQGDFESRIAPPMIAIKRHYVTEGVSQKQFTKDLIAYMKKPSASTSKMPNAVKRFGVMPTMSFSDEQLKKIAAYIYAADLEKPKWFEQHHQEEQAKYSQNQTNTPINYEELGAKYAMMTKGILGKNLLEAINTQGTDEALAFCNTKAIPLTDSVAKANQVLIKRVSDKPRNSQNNASATELAYIETAKIAFSKGEKPKPQVFELQEKMIGYYPIETNKMCLQCHGKPETDIKPSTLEKLTKFYPMDKAIGYGENQLRGIFVVEMNKK